MELFEAINKRFSNRKYLDKQISDGDLEKILKAGMQAPVGRAKYEDMHITVIQNKELLDISLCRFAGPMPNEVGNLCIAGHNYVDYKFFSRLNELKLNDKIQIYDLSGKYQEYSIYDIYETIPSDTSCTFQNTNNKKIVTLITCNNVNGKRLIIHAKEIPTK